MEPQIIGFIASYAVLWVCGNTAIPLIVLIHELGHAFVALALSQSPVTVEIGRGTDLRSYRVGRLTINARLNPPQPGILRAWVCFGYKRIWPAGRILHQRPTRDSVLLFITLGGPLASAACGACLLWLSWALGHLLMATLHADPARRPSGWGWSFFALWPWPFVALLYGVLTLLYAIINLAPRRTTSGNALNGGMQSDGLLALTIIRGRAAASPNQTRPRRANDADP